MFLQSCSSGLSEAVFWGIFLSLAQIKLFSILIIDCCWLFLSTTLTPGNPLDDLPSLPNDVRQEILKMHVPGQITLLARAAETGTQFEVKWSEVAQSCLTLCESVECSSPGSSIHGILQPRILEWVPISFSRGSSRPRDRTQVSCIAGRRFNLWATREAPGTQFRRCQTLCFFHSMHMSPLVG